MSPGKTSKITTLPALLESVALTLAFVVVALFRPGDPGLVSMAPHPMLFIGLLIAVRYGFGRGLLAAGLAMLAYYLLVFALADAPTYLHLFAPPYTDPIAVTIPATALLGAIAQSHIKRLRLLESMCQELQRRHQELAAKHADLRDVNVELAGKVMGARETLPALYRFAKALNVTDLRQIYSGLCKLAVEVLQADLVSLWEPRDDGVELIARRGVTQVTTPAPPRFGPELERRFDSAGVLALHDIPEGERAPHHPYLTGRIRAGHEGPTVAYLTVDRLAFERYTPETIRLFSMIVDWACTSVGNALAYQTGSAVPVLPDRPLPAPAPLRADDTLPPASASPAALLDPAADELVLASRLARAITAEDAGGIRQLFDEADRLLTARRLGEEPASAALEPAETPVPARTDDAGEPRLGELMGEVAELLSRRSREGSR